MKKFIQYVDYNIYEIIGITRNINEKSNQNLTLYYGDLFDLNNFEKAFDNVFMIIHAAAITHEFNEKRYSDFNCNLTEQIVDLAIQKKVERFIFISSNTANMNAGAYGKSKLLAENYIKANFDNYLIFRPSEIFGGAKNEGIDKLIEDALLKSTLVTAKGVPTKFYPIYLEDAVRWISEKTFDLNFKKQIIRINGNKGYSFLDIINYIEKTKNKKIRIIAVPKFIMFLIMYICKIIPFYIGILPDQILRLYSIKQIDSNERNFFQLEKYIETLVNKKP